SETVSTGILCAGALRSSFNLALEKLEANSIDVAGLGLAIGFEFGPLSLTRLGVKGAMVRCAIGRCVINSEAEQRRCAGNQTAIGETAKKKASVAARDIFDSARKRAHLDYDTAVSELAAKNDQTAKASLALTKALKSGTAGAGLLQPAAAVASEYRFPPRSAVPSKPAGFA
ncbi:MAG: transcriptional regulator, partial [Rhodomicrobium sp.]